MLSNKLYFLLHYYVSATKLIVACAPDLTFLLKALIQIYIPTFIFATNFFRSPNLTPSSAAERHRGSLRPAQTLKYHHTKFMPLPFRPLKLVLEKIV